MKDQKILDNAPAGNYTNVSISNGTPFIWACNNFRSLADIKELVELRKANAELVTRIAKAELAFAIVEGRNVDLEKERDELKVSMFEVSSIIKSNSRFNNYTKARWANIDSEGLDKLSGAINKALKSGN
jgi:hypothetical protein